MITLKHFSLNQSPQERPLTHCLVGILSIGRQHLFRGQWLLEWHWILYLLQVCCLYFKNTLTDFSQPHLLMLSGLSQLVVIKSTIYNTICPPRHFRPEWQLALGSKPPFFQDLKPLQILSQSTCHLDHQSEVTKCCIVYMLFSS